MKPPPNKSPEQGKLFPVEPKAASAPYKPIPTPPMFVCTHCNIGCDIEESGYGGRDEVEIKCRECGAVMGTHQTTSLTYNRIRWRTP
jgi:hypothetical protein